MQQALLMEASEVGVSSIDRSMCQLINAGMPVLFEDYWERRCNQEIGHLDLRGIFGCLSDANNDPAECFGNTDPDGWLVDPFKDGKIVPPKPPVSPQK